MKNKTSRRVLLKGGLMGFLLSFVGITISDLFTGYISRVDMDYHEPISWKEYCNNLSTLIIGSLLAGVFVAIIYSQAKKNDEWRLNEARKRIAERDKKEKEEQLAEQKK